jgi:phosphoribosylformylglycinamidine cyclo-ligase
MTPDDRTGYQRAGVDLRAAEDTLSRIERAVASTYTPGVLRGLGAFGGLFAMPSGLREPVLVASTDGVGTKTMVATALDAFETIGRDLVNHCVNDILVQGATPLFFLDYVASARLVPETTARVVQGVADACRAAGMALLGGETAEMPGVYHEGELDLAGTIVGVVERSAIVDGAKVKEGDVLLGLGSGGLQTNGFSLARSVLGDALHEPLAGGTVGEALLAEHRSFLPAVRPLLEAGLVRAMAHVTGGGLPGNLPRSLPAGLGATVTRGTWPEPDVFALLRRRGDLADDEMFEVFNMGVGFVVVVAEDDVERARALTDEPLYAIGHVTRGEGVRVVGTTSA